MNKTAAFALIALLTFSVVPATADTIDLGRGVVPLTVPEDYSKDSPAPLVVLLHGYTSSGKQQESYMKFGNLVNKYGFLYLTPDGTVEDSDNKFRFWNATDACCNFRGSTVDDSNYIKDLIDAVKKKYSVDNDRVYLIGHSNGGFMSHRVAYDHPETIAAIASLAGASLAEMNGSTPSRPVNILQIHGTKDSTIRYEGADINGTKYPGAAGSVENWAVYNAVELQKKELRKKIDLDKRLEGKDTTVTRYDKKGTVELWTINDGGHIPSISDTFTKQVIEWLYDHPKSGD